MLVDVINDGFNHELTHTPVSEFAALIAERDADIAQAKQEARRLVEELTPAEIRARIKLLGGKRRCSVDGCESKHRARGFCFGHYKRFRRYGDPLGTRPCRLCAIDGCDQEHYARSYCYKHYKKARRSGDLVAGRVSQGGAE